MKSQLLILRLSATEFLSRTCFTLAIALAVFSADLMVDAPTLSADEKDIATETASEFLTGRAALESGDFETAVKHFENVVKAAPENAEYHHALGLAYMGVKNANAGWFHFRQSVRLDPGRESSVADFMRIWKSLDNQGLFNVGIPIATVIRTLGKPDQFANNDKTARATYGFMSLNFVSERLFSVVDLRNLPPDGLEPADGLYFPLPDDWSVAYRILTVNQGNTEYLPPGQTVQNWSTLFSSQRFLNSAKRLTSLQVLENMRKQLEQSYPSFELEVLQQDNPNDVMFRWRIDKTGEQPAQFEVVRIVSGKSDIHRIAYTQKGDDWDRAAILEWMPVLEKAELLPIEELTIRQRQQSMESQLLLVTRKVLEAQLKFLKEGNIEMIRNFVAPEHHAKITEETINKAPPQLASSTPADLADHITLELSSDGNRATVYTKNNKPFLKLIERDQTWLADNVWFLTD